MSEDLAADLAVRLRDAHRAIATSSLTVDEKSIAARRLIALSDTAKVDLASASRRLDRLLADLDSGAMSSDAGPGQPPRA